MKYTTEIKQSIQQFLMMARRIWRVSPTIAMLILLSRMLQSLLPLGILYTIKSFVDIIASGDVRCETLIYPILQYALLQITISFVTHISSYWESTFQQISLDTFSNQIIDKSINIEYQNFEDPAFQNTLYLAQRQARSRISQLLPAIYGTLSGLLSLFFLILFFISLKAYFFIAIFTLAIPVAVNKWIQGKKTTDLEFKLAPKERESSYLFQILTGLSWAKEVRTLLYGNTFKQEFSNIRTHISEEKKKIQQKAFASNFASELLEVILIIAIILFLAYQSTQQVISIGLFVLYLQGIQRIQSSSKTLLQSILQIFQLRLFMRDLIGYFNIEEATPMNDSILISEFDEIRINNLSFTYPNSLVPALEQINIQAKKGEIIAIVGENGSGKSTLVKILAGLYRPNLGSIQIDGKDVNKIPAKEYHKHTAFLFQDYEKYYMEAEKNIHFESRPNEHMSWRAENSAKKSDAHEFLTRLKSGYKTKLGSMYEESEELSGGQWQRIALARVFYKDSSLMVLDEPSSSLDTFSELRLYEEIKRISKTKIVFIISHRLYNLKLADHIYVMKDGKITQHGKFSELIEEDGFFKKMYAAQNI